MTSKESIAKYGQFAQQIRQAIDNDDMEAARKALDELDQHQKQQADLVNRGEPSGQQQAGQKQDTKTGAQRA